MSGIISYLITPPVLSTCHINTIPPQYRVKLTFVLFDVKQCSSCSCDHVMVRNGNTMYSTQLGKFCGARKPSPALISKGRYAMITFKRGSNPAGKGFVASYVAVDSNESEKRKLIRRKLLCLHFGVGFFLTRYQECTLSQAEVKP